jgi:hypothetical protein
MWQHCFYFQKPENILFHHFPSFHSSLRVDRGVQTIYSELWVRSPPATFEEASRRASTIEVPSWGADLGSGSVPKPSMAVLASRGSMSGTRPGTNGSSYGTRPGTSGSGASGWPWGSASAWGSRPGTSGTQRSSSPPQQLLTGTSPDIWIGEKSIRILMFHALDT